jgi:hypothetical protein
MVCVLGNLKVGPMLGCARKTLASIGSDAARGTSGVKLVGVWILNAVSVPYVAKHVDVSRGRAKHRVARRGKRISPWLEARPEDTRRVRRASGSVQTWIPETVP